MTTQEVDQKSALEPYGVDVTLRARDGKLDPAIGRENEVRRVIQVLLRPTENNPVLIGEPGTGKMAMVEGLALRIAAKEERLKELLEEIVADEHAMVRLGAHEFGRKFSVSRRVGAPPGYVGYEEGAKALSVVHGFNRACGADELDLRIENTNP